MVTLYGIKNCDTVKKARKWLDDHHIEYRFHDFRADGLERPLLEQLEDALGWESMLNRRSTSWRQLPEQQQTGLNRETALQLMLDSPTLIKRPVLNTGSKTLIGFKAADYQAEL